MTPFVFIVFVVITLYTKREVIAFFIAKSDVNPVTTGFYIKKKVVDLTLPVI